jgi:hypothetical protein
LSLFAFRRNDEDDVAALRRAQQELARDVKSLQARVDEQNDLLWTIAVPAWLCDSIRRAGATGWRIEQQPSAVVFHRPEGQEHSFRVELPLSDDPGRVDALRKELQMRIMVSAERAA